MLVKPREPAMLAYIYARRPPIAKIAFFSLLRCRSRLDWLNWGCRSKETRTPLERHGARRSSGPAGPSRAAGWSLVRRSGRAPSAWWSALIIGEGNPATAGTVVKIKITPSPISHAPRRRIIKAPVRLLASTPEDVAFSPNGAGNTPADGAGLHERRPETPPRN